jgi:hypothetical protein
MEYLNIRNYSLPELNFTAPTSSAVINADGCQTLALAVENVVESAVSGASMQLEKALTEDGPWFADGEPVEVTATSDSLIQASQPVDARFYKLTTDLDSGELTQNIQVLGKGPV